MAVKIGRISEVIKHFTSIPGPKFPIIHHLPGGKLYKKPFIEVHRLYWEKYGDLVRLPGLFGRSDTVLVYKPEDIEKVLREDTMPIRPAFSSLKYYRKTRPDVFKVGGLMIAQEDEWRSIRTALNPIMMHPKVVESYTSKVGEVCQDFVGLVEEKLDENCETPSNFDNLIDVWSIETIGLIAFSKRINALSLHETNDGVKLTHLVNEAFKLFYEVEVAPSLWMMFNSPALKKLTQTLEEITKIVTRILDEDFKNIETKENSKYGVLQKLLKNNQRDIAVSNAFDMILAGTDTTSSSTNALLYLLAKNPEKQVKLRNELVKVLPNKNDPLTPKKMHQMPYMKACLKEVHRVFPVTTEIMRKTKKDIVLQDFQIPKGTVITMATGLLLEQEENFSRAKEFIPERWLKEETKGCSYARTAANPFAYLPFGFGVRMCIGKRITDLETSCLIAKMVRNFEISWHYGEPKLQCGLIRSYTDLKFKMQKIEV